MCSLEKFPPILLSIIIRHPKRHYSHPSLCENEIKILSEIEAVILDGDKCFPFNFVAVHPLFNVENRHAPICANSVTDMRQ